MCGAKVSLAALGQRTERDDFRHFPWPQWSDCDAPTTRHGPQPTQCRAPWHAQENEAGTIRPVCNCGLEDQTAEHILQRCPLLHTARTWQMCGHGSPAALNTLKPWPALRQQGGTWRRQLSTFTTLADWTLSVAAIEKKKKTSRKGVRHNWPPQLSFDWREWESQSGVCKRTSDCRKLQWLLRSGLAKPAAQHFSSSLNQCPSLSPESPEQDDGGWLREEEEEEKGEEVVVLRRETYGLLGASTSVVDFHTAPA